MEANNGLETFILEAIIAAIIGAGTSLVIAVITNAVSGFRSARDIKAKIGQLENTTLAGQHLQILSGVQNATQVTNQVQKSIGGALPSIDFIKTTVDKMQSNQAEKEIKETERYYQLTQEQRNILQNVDALIAITNEFKRMQERVLEMEYQLAEKDKELQELKDALEQSQVQSYDHSRGRGY